MTTNSEQSPRGPLQPHPAGLKERGYRLYQQGMSNREIAKKLGVPLNTLARWSSKQKWKLRKELAGHVETGLSALAPTNQDTLNKLAQLPFEQKQEHYHTGASNEALRMLEAIKQTPTGDLVRQADKIAKLDATARKALALEEHKPKVVVNVALLTQIAERRRIIAAQEVSTPKLPTGEPAPDGEPRT
jgi:hypothetical protein